MRHSFYLYRLAALLRASGLRVYLHDHDLDAIGRYDHENREIRINCLSARGALITLAHEAGHWLGYVFGERRHSYQRERQAFAYGWRALKLIGADRLVTRAGWIAEGR